uniref:acyl carrier protein phosphodiesterase n=1 Tax=uncultured Draconibacterium sp. TaxID=1573823 RepID=UPI0032167B82
MNYLAHLYLSGSSEQVTIGNFIGDYVKGKKYLDYNKEISKGIIMHRNIDSFTDKHESTRLSKEFFRKDFGLYSGIIVDLFYDHFLAKNWADYSSVTLRTFAKRMHAILLSNYLVLPRRVQGFLPFLIQNKRLESYATVDGIIQSLKIMGNYSSVPQKSEKARIILQENYMLLEEYFKIFMKDMVLFARSEFMVELYLPVEQN